MLLGLLLRLIFDVVFKISSEKVNIQDIHKPTYIIAYLIQVLLKATSHLFLAQESDKSYPQ